jgi:hypothetical protein
MQEIQVIHSPEIKANGRLRDEIADLISPKYINTAALLEREIGHCNTLYLRRDAQGSLTCFFMVASETLSLNSEGTLAILYLGLSATKDTDEHTGQVTALYARCLADAVRWEREHSQRLILWGTTATPTIYLGVRLILAEANPDLHGRYAKDSAVIAQALRSKLQIPAANSTENPFVLKGIANDTQYAPPEAERLQKLARRKEFDLFESLGIDERKGDRLLFIGRTPTKLPRMFLS